MPTDPPYTLVLAPMEGVIDAAMRNRLTGIGGYTRCVTEFIRVTNVLLPERVFLRLCPELARGGCTDAGVPVYVQLLGSDPRVLAANAVRAVSLGAPGIDLNFGCPAKTVNDSLGGSVLLRDPLRVATIVRIVREAVPGEIPVTVKIRLGFEHADALAEIADGVRAAGATELAVHARTKFDGYRPPAYWERVRTIVAESDDNTIINGEIWTVADSLRARQLSGCRHLMLGRGALAAPDLAQRVRAGIVGASPLAWNAVLEHVEAQFLAHDRSSPRHVGNRTKQWLVYLKRTYPQAAALFQRVRTLHDVPTICAAIATHRQQDLLS